jgi:hypothetical protein
MDGGTDAGLLVLHALRLSGFTTATAISDRWGLEPAVVDGELASLRAEGWANYREGRLTGWMLSTEGRAEGERRLRAELEAAAARPVVEAAYEQFLPLNVEFLSVCTDWQLRDADGEQIINDHSDPAHDGAVVERLVTIHDGVVSVVDAVRAPVPRFAVYGPRFHHAIERVRANDVDWFTKPVIDSYHTIWFELHEDLLATLGRSRESESAGRA